MQGVYDSFKFQQRTNKINDIKKRIKSTDSANTPFVAFSQLKLYFEAFNTQKFHQ